LQKNLKQPTKISNDLLVEKNSIQISKAQSGTSAASLTGRDPRLQPKQKRNVSTNPEAETVHNFPNQNAPPTINNLSLGSPVKKSSQLLKPQQNIEFQAMQNQPNLKRTSPNSAQSPNPTEVKKPKYTNLNLINKPGNNEEKPPSNETMKIVKTKKVLLTQPPTVSAQQQPHQNLIHEQIRSSIPSAKPTTQQANVNKSTNKIIDNEIPLNKSPKQKQ
jgi:hypothetical protein